MNKILIIVSNEFVENTNKRISSCKYYTTFTFQIPIFIPHIIVLIMLRHFTLEYDLIIQISCSYLISSEVRKQSSSSSTYIVSSIFLLPYTTCLRAYPIPISGGYKELRTLLNFLLLWMVQFFSCSKNHQPLIFGVSTN